MRGLNLPYKTITFIVITSLFVGMMYLFYKNQDKDSTIKYLTNEVIRSTMSENAWILNWSILNVHYVRYTKKCYAVSIRAKDMLNEHEKAMIRIVNDIIKVKGQPIEIPLQAINQRK